jgi:RNA polymerase sigma factor FliA
MWQKERDEEAGNYLVEKYLPLVHFVVERLALNLPHTVQKDDLKSLGYEGLLDAIDRFEIERELKFETYASWRIKGAILDGLRKNDWLPRSIREKSKKIGEAYAVLQQDKLTAVTDDEVCRYLGINQTELHTIVQDTTLATALSIDEAVYEDDYTATSRGHLIEDINAESPEKHMSEQVIKETLAAVINRLPEKEKLVISLCYFEELTMTEAAEVLDLSISRISQLHSKALLRLKGAMNAY